MTAVLVRPFGICGLGASVLLGLGAGVSLLGGPFGAGDWLGEKDEVGAKVGDSVSQRSYRETLLWAELVSVYLSISFSICVQTPPMFVYKWMDVNAYSLPLLEKDVSMATTFPS